MEKLNDLLETAASPFKAYANCLLKIGLGISFFLHGFGKLPISEGFVGWLTSKGISSASVVAPMIAWGEILAGLGILLGGLIGTKAAILGNVVTRLSGGAIGIIMIGAIMIAHSDWGIFTGERLSLIHISEPTRPY